MKFSFLLAIVLACGCGQDGIKVYTVPKEQPAQPDVAAAPTAPPLTWKTPAGWTETPASEMRVASFKITGADDKQADVSVIPLPGVAGGDLSNVNRWRGQVGLPPVPEDGLPRLAQPVELAGQPAQLYEQAGESSAILAVIQRREGTSWFFKMTGDPKVVARQKPAFVEFLRSIQFAASEAPAGLPAGHPDVSAAPPVAASAAGQPKWEVPAGWKEVSGGQFLVAKFVIAGNGQAAVNVSSSAGNGGGLGANVNRWRKQLGLGELTGDELAKFVKTSGPATFVTLRGQSASLVGAIVSQPGQTWFYKLMGDAPVVASQQEAFVTFVLGVQY
jgi:hypothetical protein